MASYRDRLPQLEDRPFITDGGIETTLSLSCLPMTRPVPFRAGGDVCRERRGHGHRHVDAIARVCTAPF